MTVRRCELFIPAINIAAIWQKAGACVCAIYDVIRDRSAVRKSLKWNNYALEDWGNRKSSSLLRTVQFTTKTGRLCSASIWVDGRSRRRLFKISSDAKNVSRGGTIIFSAAAGGDDIIKSYR